MEPEPAVGVPHGARHPRLRGPSLRRRATPLPGTGPDVQGLKVGRRPGKATIALKPGAPVHTVAAVDFRKLRHDRQRGTLPKLLLNTLPGHMGIGPPKCRPRRYPRDNHARVTLLHHPQAQHGVDELVELRRVVPAQGALQVRPGDGHFRIERQHRRQGGAGPIARIGRQCRRHSYRPAGLTGFLGRAPVFAAGQQEGDGPG